MNNRIDRESARAVIVGLDLPAVVLDVFDAKKPNDVLAMFCEDPYYTFQPNSGLPPRFVPLWEDSTNVTGFDRDDRLFKRIDLELPSNPMVFGSSFSDVAADMLMRMHMAEVDEADLVRVADALEYKHLTGLRAAMTDTPWDADQSYWEWCREVRKIVSDSA